MNSVTFIHPEFKIELYRYLSFEDWPKALKQKPLELADAGFFYLGKGDKVACFSCGVGLQDWEDLDVPWEQHVLWYKDCEYLKIRKGQAFINNVLSMKNKILSFKNNLELKDEKDNLDKDEKDSINKDEKLCKMCYGAEYDTTFLPCGHVFACSKCAFCFSHCPYCRNLITQIVKIYFT